MAKSPTTNNVKIKPKTAPNNPFTANPTKLIITAEDTTHATFVDFSIMQNSCFVFWLKLLFLPFSWNYVHLFKL